MRLARGGARYCRQPSATPESGRIAVAVVPTHTPCAHHTVVHQCLHEMVHIIVAPSRHRHLPMPEAHPPLQTLRHARTCWQPPASPARHGTPNRIGSCSCSRSESGACTVARFLRNRVSPAAVRSDLAVLCP